ALLECGLEQPHQILGLLLDFNFRVADRAKCTLPFDRITWEETADEKRGRLLQRDQADSVVAASRQLDEPLDLLRHTDERIHRLAVFDTRKLQSDREGQIGNEWKRMRRINRQRCKQRKNWCEEMFSQPVAFLLFEIAALNKHNVGRSKQGSQLKPAFLLISRELRNRLSDACQLLGWSQSVRALCQDAFTELPLEASNPHHKKFVKVVCRNRQEAHTLK